MSGSEEFPVGLIASAPRSGEPLRASQADIEFAAQAAAGASTNGSVCTIQSTGSSGPMPATSSPGINGKSIPPTSVVLVSSDTSVGSSTDGSSGISGSGDVCISPSQTTGVSHTAANSHSDGTVQGREKTSPDRTGGQSADRTGLVLDTETEFGSKHSKRRRGRPKCCRAGSGQREEMIVDTTTILTSVPAITSSIRTNPGTATSMGFIANGPYYDGSDITILPPRPPTGWLMGAADPRPAKKCLVLDLDETLVHSSFNPVMGANLILPITLDGKVYNVFVRKRPGVDEFLARVGELFDTVIFTASLCNYADPVLDRLDPQGICKYRLYRDACTFMSGFYIKDLTRLGRPLNSVVIIDNSPASYQFQPQNAIAIDTWYEDPSDTQLSAILPLLERLASCDDVTSVLAEYR